jgi:hypothetical protein
MQVPQNFRNCSIKCGTLGSKSFKETKTHVRLLFLILYQAGAKSSYKLLKNPIELWS